MDAISLELAEEDILSSTCKQAIERIQEILRSAKNLRGSLPTNEKNSACSLKKTRWRLISQWLKEIQPKALPKSKLGKAIQYSLSHKDGLQVYLQDGNIVLSNNICERAIRNFTISRKNWLFSDKRR